MAFCTASAWFRPGSSFGRILIFPVGIVADKSNEQPGQFRGGYKVGHGGDKLSTLEQTAINSQRRFETLRGKGYGGLMTSGAVDVQTDRQFAKGTTDALDNAFREETIGLVTKEKFVETRRTIAERLEEEKRKKGKWPVG